FIVPGGEKSSKCSLGGNFYSSERKGPASEEEDLDVVVSGPKLKPTEMPLSSFVMMIIAESPKSRFYIYWGIMPERHEWEGCNGLQGWMEMIGRRMARL
ncbi:hypothetical protein B296_00024034, partial [Ensete ventricosum]